MLEFLCTVLLPPTRPYPSTPLHGLGAVTFFYGTIMFNGLWLAIINEAERLLGPTRVKQELGYSRHARFNQCHRALFRVQVSEICFIVLKSQKKQ